MIALTGLPNRQLFEDRLSQALARGRRSGRPAGLLCIDVDRLKDVNQSFGHAVADRLLGSFAERLAALVREQDTVARLSGDKFAVLLAEMQQAASAEVVARKVLEACRRPHQIDGHELSLSCSIGISVYPDDAESKGDLLRAASDAVHAAKQVRHTWARYTQGMHRPASAMPLAFSSVRRALEAGHLAVHYQPQVRLADGAVTGVEALVRWVDPERGLMSTIDLIRAAEETGLIVPLSEHVMRVAMRDALQWRSASGAQIALAVNISGVQFRGGALVPMVSRLLEESGFPPDALVLEITESTAMQSTSSALSALDDLRALGIRMAVDDFGTGYSSLSRLHRLPVDAVKIDRSFVQGLGASDSTAVIAKTIVTMAHSLGLKVTAEGVEQRCELDALAGYGCDEAQGFLLSVPLDATLLANFLARSTSVDGRDLQRAGGLLLAVQVTHVGQVAVLPRVVQAVSDHEAVLNREADVLDGHVDFSARGLAQQACRSQRLRTARPQDLLQVTQRQPGIHDVLDDDDMPAVQGGVEVLEQPDFARRCRARGIARDRKEIERAGQRHGAHQIGQEEHRSLQHADEMQAAGAGGVSGNLGAELAHARGDLIG